MASIHRAVLRPGERNDLRSGSLLTIDIGFAEKARSSAWALDEDDVELGTFAELKAHAVACAGQRGQPLNVIIEAPLSVAFNRAGNPTPRRPEVAEDKKRRAWYTGPGAAVLIAATYLVRAIAEAKRAREVRLFEGFVSFKPQRSRSDHAADVRLLRGLAFGERGASGEILERHQLGTQVGDTVQSAFALADLDLDLGVPAVVMVKPPARR